MENAIALMTCTPPGFPFNGAEYTDNPGTQAADGRGAGAVMVTRELSGGGDGGEILTQVRRDLAA